MALFRMDGCNAGLLLRDVLNYYNKETPLSIIYKYP